MNKKAYGLRCVVVRGGVVVALAAGYMLVSGPRMLAQSAALPAPATPLYSAIGPVPLQVVGGDLLDVQVFNTPELSSRFRVDRFGNLNLPLGGAIHVAGLTTAEVSSAIEDRLKSQRLMRDPHVTVLVAEYATQMVSVLGEVKKPGPVPIYGVETLYDVLAAAGGVSYSAGSSISISHRDDPSPPLVIQVRTANYSAIEHTTTVQPGDTVLVSLADSVYTLGALNRQGAVPLLNGAPLTLLNVLSLSGGLTQIAKGSKAAIIRQASNGAVTTIDVDIPRVIQRKAPDLLMQSSDILVVPTSGLKYTAQLLLPYAASAVISSAVASVISR